MKNILYAALITLLAACTSTQYSIVTGEETEIIREVEVEVEVPVYVEVEVPVYVDSGGEDPGVIWIDSFTQPMSIDGIDILWVIDRSGSMGRYHTELLNGIQAMLTALPTSDWRLVIINADPTHSITSTEFPLVPGDDIEDAEDMLNTLRTAHREEGFNATYEYIANNPYASTWMRPDAGLLVVFVSDEEEQSDYEYPAVSDFLSWYTSQRMGSVFLASVVNRDASESLCTTPPLYIDVGERYMEATNLLGGTVVDICDEDWSPGVTDATHSIEPYEKLALTYTPEDPNTIRVFINGTLNSDWYYSTTENTVHFTIIPSAGDLVEIGYRYYEVTGTGDTGT